MGMWEIEVEHASSMSHDMGHSPCLLKLRVEAEDKKRAMRDAEGAVRDTMYHTDVDAHVKAKAARPAEHWNPVSGEWTNVYRLEAWR